MGIQQLINPVSKFMAMLLEMWNAFPLAIQLLITLIITIVALFAVLNIMKT